MMQLPLFYERVQFRGTYQPTLDRPGVPETSTGWVLHDYGNGDVFVKFDGKWRVGSVAGCRLIIPRKDLEPVSQ